MATTPEPSNPVTEAVKANADHHRDVTEKIRGRAETTAKTFGTLATAGVTALGISKLGDIWPFPDGLYWPIVGILIGFFGMVGVVAFFTARLWGVSQPILTNTDPDLMDELSPEERKMVAETYENTAKVNAVKDLRTYAARGRRFIRIADNRPPGATDTASLRDRGAGIRMDVQATTALGIARIVRRRAGLVVRSKLSLVAILAFAAAAATFAISADRLESARAAEIATAKSCAEARTAKAREDRLPKICGDEPENDNAQIELAKACADARAAKAIEEMLPSSCGEPVTEAGETETTAEDQADAAFAALAEARSKCRAAFRQAGGTGASSCVALDRAIIAAIGEVG